MVRKSAAVVLAVVATFTATHAHAQYFGRNKVHYDRLDFRLLQTDHFDIYYYAEEEEATVHAARMAERWYARLSRILDHTFSKRQPLILYAAHSHFAQTNLTGGFIGEGVGGFTERVKSRIALPFAPGLGETDHVLGHEIAHAFQIDIARSVKRDAFELPGWFIEGMAEYLSLGPAGAHTSMWVRDAARYKRLPTLDQLNSPKYFPYRYGHALWSYLAARHGDGILGAVLRSRVRGAVKRLEQATGESAGQIAADWHASVDVTTAPATNERAASTERGRMEVAPALSPDGTRVMFLSERDRLSVDLFLSSVDTSQDARKIVSSATDPHFDSLQYIDSAGAWDPAGKRFAMAAVHDGNAVLVVVEVLSGERDEIPIPGIRQLFNPSWSPDGTQVVISGLKGGLSDLFIYTVDTGALRQLTTDPFADIQPVWSPDGVTIAFASDRFTSSIDELRFGPLRIALLDVATGVIRPLAEDDAGARHARDKQINPQWSPDSSAVYYVADESGISNVYRRSLATGELRQVTGEDAGVSGITATSPALAVASRTGTIAYTAYEKGAYRIRVLDGCGSCPILERHIDQPSGRATEATMTVAGALRDPLSGLPDSSSFTRREYDDRLRLESLAQPFIGGGTGNAFGGVIRASFGATFGDLLRDRQLQTLFRVGTDLDDLAAQVAYTTRRGRWNWGVTAGFMPARFYGARRALARDAELTTRETTSLRYNHQWGGLVGRFHIDAVRRLEARVGVRRTSFEWQTATRVMTTGGELVDRTFLEAPAGPALYQVEAQFAFVHDTAVFGPLGPVLGQRLRVEVEPAFGGVPFTDVRIDARRYWMPVRPLTFAARIEHVGRYGSGAADPRLTPLVAGLQTLVRGYDLRTYAADACGRSATSCSVIDKLTGSRLALLNLELRVPLLGPLTGELNYGGHVPIELIAFADGGALWTRQAERTGRAQFRSLGAGGRANIGGFVVEVTASRPFDRTPDGWRVGFLLRPAW